MTIKMIAECAFQDCGPMIGHFSSNKFPACKMKHPDVDRGGMSSPTSSDDDLILDFDLNGQDNMDFDFSTLGSGDIDVLGLANLIERDHEPLQQSLLGDVLWPVNDAYLNDAVLDFHNDQNNAHDDTEEASHTHSPVTGDHIYSLSRDIATVTEPPSRAASTSGYSSGTESLISNEDGALSLFPSTTKKQRRKGRGKTAATESPGSQAPRKRSRKSETKTCVAMRMKKWSKMCEEEQQTSIVELTEVISSQLGVRERLEAIKIINPHTDASPTDTQVIIDMKPINDYRFRKLHKFVQMHADDYTLPSASSLSQQNSEKPQQLASLSLDVADQLVACTQNKTGRKRKGKGSRREQKALCDQLSREEQQRAKEVESGLFVHEIRVCVEEDDDDENIDILT